MGRKRYLVFRRILFLGFHLHLLAWHWLFSFILSFLQIMICDSLFSLPSAIFFPFVFRYIIGASLQLRQHFRFIGTDQVEPAGNLVPLYLWAFSSHAIAILNKHVDHETPFQLCWTLFCGYITIQCGECQCCQCYSCDVVLHAERRLRSGSLPARTMDRSGWYQSIDCILLRYPVYQISYNNK